MGLVWGDPLVLVMRRSAVRFRSRALARAQLRGPSEHMVAPSAYDPPDSPNRKPNDGLGEGGGVVAGSLRAVAGSTDVWELRVYLGRDPAGRVRHRHARFHGSRRQAERELARMIAEQDAAPQPAPE